jgi:hypothetical protein
VEEHWVHNEVPEMTLEKLQLLATSTMSTPHKVKVVKWWNLSGSSREALKFPVPPVSEDKFTIFLGKIVWWAAVRSLNIGNVCFPNSISLNAI